MKKITFSLLLMSFMMLSGCLPLVAGGLIVGAGSAAYINRSAINHTYTDTNITHSASAAILKNPDLAKGTHIVIATQNSVVLLAGQVSYPSQRIEAEQAVTSVPGIIRLYNEIEVAGPTTQLTRASDSWITTKVKSGLMTTRPSPGKHIKVVTENGTVYLLGNVSQAQADAAVNVVRQVAGVQKVVKLFDYTD